MKTLTRRNMRLIVVSLALIILALLASMCQSTPPNSGIEGIVLLGPTCPVVRPGMEDECADRPYQAKMIVQTADGRRTIAHFQSGADGHFRVALQPGKYLLGPESGGPMLPRMEPQTVVVEPGVYTTITIHYDTGIR